jgi:TfoX/Sxy family transcriptional regulator of competence genes
MSTTQKTVDFICAQSGLAQRITARKMFGEFALYVEGKVVALVCDDTLFVKPTPVVAELLGAVDLQPPYSGAKPHFCITEQLDDRELLQRILLLTAEVMPLPKAKTKAKAPAKSKASTGTAARKSGTGAATRPATKSTRKTAPRKVTKSPVKKAPAKRSAAHPPKR